MNTLQFERKVRKLLKTNFQSITYGIIYKDKKREFRDLYVHYFDSLGLHKCFLAYSFEEMLEKLEKLNEPSSH